MPATVSKPAGQWNRRIKAMLPSFYVQDHFTGTDGTLLNAHTPDVGGPWTQAGSLKLLSGKAVWNSSAPGSDFAIAGVATAINCYMQVDITGSECGVFTNMQDVDNLWMGWYSGGSLILYQRSGPSTFISRGSVVYTPTTIKLVSNGDTIELWGDGVLKVTYTVANRPYKSNARSGIMVYLTFGSFDNAEAGA